MDVRTSEIRVRGGTDAGMTTPNKKTLAIFGAGPGLGASLATRFGKVYQGLLVYESPEGYLLQSGPDTTLRISGEDVLTLEPSRQSLMPTGLLNDLTDRELSDLYAYLKTLQPRQ